MTEVERQAIRTAVNNCDQRTTNRLITVFSLRDGSTVDALNAFLAAVHSASHEVQTWWLGECNCDGHLN